MTIFVVGPTASGKSTLLREFIGAHNGKTSIVILDDCTAKQYKKIKAAKLDNVLLVVAMYDKNEVNALATRDDFIITTGHANYQKEYVRNGVGLTFDVNTTNQQIMRFALNI
jgi:ABC-type cobalamin/Fe3+-siderophores transport system ATPase subunit